ncbi:hypothetical protein EII34_15325 [Arachnia propionica]|uniref:Uncharacterized protein n=1 Tax=Arachnia propionica TaxID=1750 RepID=A0A3P1T3S2_9ACTN|nr:hypothetical protein [Arachnia propionica]RRD03143.1 hypothetical protein EII34_15325 [Arachnia propionica]
MEDLPTPGEVFAWRHERLGLWCAAQVLGRASWRIVAAALAWQGDHAPTLSELTSSPAMQYSCWTLCVAPRPLVAELQEMPDGWVPLGRLPRLVAPPGTELAHDLAEGILWQHRWEQKPPEALHRFVEAATVNDPVTIPTVRDRATGEPVTLHPLQDMALDDTLDQFDPLFTLDDLAVWPTLEELQLTRWHDDLLPWLARSPMVETLSLECHGQTSLDLSRTWLREVRIDTTGLEELRLPRSIDSCTLVGARSPGFRLHAPLAGRWLRLTCSAPLPGQLPQLRELELRHVDQLDLPDLVATHPRLRRLVIEGCPSPLHDLESLTRLPTLTELRLISVLGFRRVPTVWPRLDHLVLQCLPDEVIDQAERDLTRDGLYLATLRHPDWPGYLADHDVPLRRWLGRLSLPHPMGFHVWRTFARARDAIRQAEPDDRPRVATEGIARLRATALMWRGHLGHRERCDLLDAQHRLRAAGNGWTVGVSRHSSY